MIFGAWNAYLEAHEKETAYWQKELRCDDERNDIERALEGKLNAMDTPGLLRKKIKAKELAAKVPPERRVKK